MDNNLHEDIKRDAYQKALQFKNTGLEEEVIFARLEKLGFPTDLAQEVAKNVVMKKREDKEKELPTSVNQYSVWSKLIKAIFPKLKI